MRTTKIYHSLTTMLALIALMFVSIVLLDAPPQIPLAMGCAVAGLVAKWIGYRWDEILEGMLGGITNSLEAVLIILCVGMMMGTWISCGAVPSMIYYGLKLINARFFLAATFLVCAVVSMAAGSWGAAGTVGLAFAAIGTALGIPAGMTAGAIVSGAYVGDKCSPLSDSTNLAAATAHCDVIEAVKQMLGIALAVCGLAAVGFLLLGLRYGGGDSSLVSQSVEPILAGLRGSFNISPLCLLPLVIVVACILLKVPSMPSLGAGILSGGVLAAVMQGRPAAEIFASCYSGFVSESGSELLDTLLTAGGIEAMMNTVSVIIIAMAFGGVMQSTGQMAALAAPLMRRVRSATGLTVTTILTCIGANMVLPDQYLGISVPGQMYFEEYEKRGIDRRTLANILGAGGAVTSPLIPWNTCGSYMQTVLGVGAAAYLPYAFFCLLMPVAMVLFVAVKTRKKRADKR